MKYLGPANNFLLEEGGTVYHRGDDVPISPELAKHLGHPNQGGHRFEGQPAQRRASAASKDEQPTTAP